MSAQDDGFVPSIHPMLVPILGIPAAGFLLVTSALVSGGTRLTLSLPFLLLAAGLCIAGSRLAWPGRPLPVVALVVWTVCMLALGLSAP